MALKQLSRAVTQSIEGCAQRPPPLLVPSFAPGIAAAIASPALHAMRTAPGGVLNDLHLMGRWKLFQELTIICEPRVHLRLDGMQCEDQRHIAVAVVMSVSFAVSGNVHELRPVPGIREPAFQAGGELLTTVQQLLESHRLGDRAVIEEEVNAAS